MLQKRNSLVVSLFCFLSIISLFWFDGKLMMKWHLSIAYKKTNEWYNKWQRMTTSDNEWYNEWQRMTTSGTTSDNEWYNEWQRVVERMTTSGTMSDNEWYNEWQRVVQRLTAKVSRPFQTYINHRVSFHHFLIF